MSSTSPTSDAGGVASAPEPRLPGRGWASGVRQSKHGSASLAMIQPNCSSSGDILLAGIILSSRDTMAPRVRPRCSAITARSAPAPPRRAPRLPPPSTAPPARQAEHHRHPRPQIRWSRTDNAPVRGDTARRELPRSSPCRGLLEGGRIDDTEPILLRRDGPVPQHEHRGSTITTRMPGVCKRSPRICKVPMWT